MTITWWRNPCSPHLQQNRDTTRAVVTPVCPPCHSRRSSTSESSTRECPILNFYINTCQCSPALCIFSLFPSFLPLPFSTTPTLHVFMCGICMCSCVLRPENDTTCLILFLTILFFWDKASNWTWAHWFRLSSQWVPGIHLSPHPSAGSRCVLLCSAFMWVLEIRTQVPMRAQQAFDWQHHLPALPFVSLCVVMYSTTCSSSIDICFHEYASICGFQCSDVSS